MLQPHKTLTILGAIACLLLAALVLMRLLDDPVGPASGQGATRDEALLRELAAAQVRTAELLERVEAHLADDLERPAAPQRGSSSEAAPPPSLEALVGSLDALRASIEAESQRTQELIRRSPAMGGESLSSVRNRRAEPNWALLRTLANDWDRDLQLARRSQYFLSTREVLETYGPPTEVYSGGQIVYGGQPQDEDETTWNFRIVDGYVVDFHVERVRKKVDR